MSKLNSAVVKSLTDRLTASFIQCAKAVEAKSPGDGLEFADAIAGVNAFYVAVAKDVEQRAGPKAVATQVVKRLAIELLIDGLGMGKVYRSNEDVLLDLVAIRRDVFMAVNDDDVARSKVTFDNVLKAIDKLTEGLMTSR